VSIIPLDNDPYVKLPANQALLTCGRVHLLDYCNDPVYRRAILGSRPVLGDASGLPKLLDPFVAARFARRDIDGIVCGNWRRAFGA
jgi:hypothetical protein